MTLEDMTPGQMESAADSLLGCIRDEAWEDATYHLHQLMYAVQRHQLRAAVEAREKVRKLAVAMGLKCHQ